MPSTGTSLLLWLGCVPAALFPPLFGCSVALLLSSSHSYFLLLLAALSWSVQLVGWMWSAYNHSELYYDATGSLTFVLVIAASLFHTLTSSAGGMHLNVRQSVNSALVLVWCVRLGSHLFSRIRRDQKDGRFDSMRDSAAKLLLPWSTQGLWVFLLSLPVTLTNAMLTSDADGQYAKGALHALTWRDYAGWAVWAGMWAVEVVADRQKAAFAHKKENKSKFIQEGLWRYSRHPNYLGEMSLWFGLFLSCSAAFTRSSHYLSIAGPCFNAFILLFVSGVPLLEASSDKKFGSDPAYKQYKKSTPVLIPDVGRVLLRDTGKRSAEHSS